MPNWSSVQVMVSQSGSVVVAAGEDLVAVADRVEEVDRVAAGDAVAGRPDVDVDAVHPQDVGGPPDVGPAVEPEREVVEAAVGAAGEGDVVGLVRSLEEHDELVALVAHHLLGEAELQGLLHEAGHVGHVLGGEQAVVDAGRGDADEVGGHRRRVVHRQPVADLLHRRVDLHDVPARRVEADGVAERPLLVRGQPLDRAAVALQDGLVALEVVDRLGLEARRARRRSAPPR